MDIIPTPHKVEFHKKSNNKGEFIIEPLYPGYGITLGNMLRRVLLSSIPGAAITSAKIKGVDHEFTSLPYIKEDVVDIILNLKQVNIKMEGNIEINPEEPLIISINKKGECKITAADFKCPTQIKIANPKLHIATLTDKSASFEAEFVVEKGIGYRPIENYKGKKLDIGYIALDAIFTPINQVNAKIEHVRVGEMTNWDKLILQLETNGAVSCEEAFDTAVNILYKQINFLKDKNIRNKNIGDDFENKDNDSQTKIIDNIKEEEQGEEEIKETEKKEESAEKDSKKKRGRPKK